MQETGVGPCTIPSHPSDIERIPVFIRTGSILPVNLGDSMHLGSPTGVRGVGYRNLSFLITGVPTQQWTFTDDEGVRIRFDPNDDGLYVIADAVAVDHVYLITLGHGEHGQHEGAGRQYRAIWAAGGRRAEVVRLDAESLVQGFRLQL